MLHLCNKQNYLDTIICIHNHNCLKKKMLYLHNKNNLTTVCATWGVSSFCFLTYITGMQFDWPRRQGEAAYLLPID